MLVTNITPDLDVDPSIAIVGSSATLLEKEYGKEIDSFTDVLRFNRAPTENYEKYAGSKTTIRVVNQHVFACQLNTKRWDPKTQPQYLVREIKDTKIVSIGPQSLQQFNHSASLVDKSCSCHVAIQYQALYQLVGQQPTVGFVAMALLVNSGLKPTLYGFYGQAGGEGSKALSHYWEQRDNKAPCHNFGKEQEFLREWDEQGLLIWKDKDE